MGILRTALYTTMRTLFSFLILLSLFIYCSLAKCTSKFLLFNLPPLITRKMLNRLLSVPSNRLSSTFYVTFYTGVCSLARYTYYQYAVILADTLRAFVLTLSCSVLSNGGL